MGNIKKQVWEPCSLLNPVPAVLVSCAGSTGKTNILTVAWTGIICSEPSMVYISVRPERYSYPMIRETGEYVINLTTEALVRATDYCGVVSGKNTDKWEKCGLTPMPGAKVKAPLIAESPVNIECRVKDVLPLGSHDMFISEVVAVDVSEQYIDSKGKFDLSACGLVAYNHGEYFTLGDKLGSFGYTVRKKK